MTSPKPHQAIPELGLQFNFGPFSLRADGTLLRSMVPVSLPPRELSVLRLLLTRAGEIVPADELRQHAWSSTHVSAGSLPRCICSLRSHLNYEDSIQTVYKRGYRFNLPVKPVTADHRAEKWVERRAARFTGLPRLAILPFATGVGIPEYFGTGIAEETMLRLSRKSSPVVEVMARDSVNVLVSRGVYAIEVGKLLRADLVLNGTITALPQHFRMRAEMIRVGDSVQLWIEDFLVPRKLLAYADARIAKRISARIRDTFTTPIRTISLAAGVEESNAAEAGSLTTISEAKRSEAYTVYMQARAQWSTLQRHMMQDAIRGFHYALELDPRMTSARTQLVHSYLIQSCFGYTRPDLAAEMARKQAEAALADDPNSRSIHPALGWIYFHHGRNLTAAAQAFAHPQGSGYNPATAIYRIKFAIGQGLFEEAIGLLRSALQVDSYSPMLHSRLAWTLYLSGDSDTAMKQTRHTLDLFPNDLGALFFGSMILATSEGVSSKTKGELTHEAAALASRLIQLAPSLDLAYAALAYAQARQGYVNEARALIERLQWLGKERYLSRSFLAPALVELGDMDAAISELTLAEQAHCPFLFEVLTDPRLKPLHGKIEFQRLRDALRPMKSRDSSVA